MIFDLKLDPGFRCIGKKKQPKFRGKLCYPEENVPSMGSLFFPFLYDLVITDGFNVGVGKNMGVSLRCSIMIEYNTALAKIYLFLLCSTSF